MAFATSVGTVTRHWVISSFLLVLVILVITPNDVVAELDVLAVDHTRGHDVSSSSSSSPSSSTIGFSSLRRSSASTTARSREYNNKDNQQQQKQQHDIHYDGDRYDRPSDETKQYSQSNHQIIVNDIYKTDDNDVQNAKNLLISLGVPEINLCVMAESHTAVGAGTTTTLLLPVCPDAEKRDWNIRFSPQQVETDSAVVGRRHRRRWGMSWLSMPPFWSRQQQQAPPQERQPRWLEGSSSDGDLHSSFEDDPWFYVTHGVCALACVITAALAAGLTMGLLSLDPLMLLIKMRAGATQREKDQAAALLPIVKQHHLLLVTLLLLNSMANEALPLFLEVLVSPVVAVVLSVTFVLFFGEIIPSAVFTGPQKIELASRMVPLVRVVMFLLWPIAYPIAKVLDVVLHEDASEGAENMNRGELSALVRVQYEERMAHKRARKMEKVRYQKRESALQSSTMSTVPGGAATTATITGKATPTHAYVSSFASSAAAPVGAANGAATERVGSLNFPQPKRRSPEAEAAIKASKHQALRMSMSSTRASGHSETSGYTHNSDYGNSGGGGGGGGLKRSNSIHIDEVAMVEGALQMKTKMAMDVLTPLRRVYAVPLDLILNEDNIVDIYSSGYSRIPVYERDPDKPKSQAHIVGLLMTKHLIVVNPNDNRPLSTLPLQAPPCVSPKMNLVDMVNLFQTGQVGHLALVCARPRVGADSLCAGHVLPATAGLMGIITMEDVFEALLQEQIYDEMDQMEREADKIARWVCRKWRHYKAVKLLEEEDQRRTMADVVEDAMERASSGGGASSSVGETSFLLGKKKEDRDTNSAGGIIGFFQSLGNNNE